MSRSILHFIKTWMLPIAMALGIGICLILHYIPSLHLEHPFSSLARNIQPWLVAIMLFLQFVKVSPEDLRLRKWHFFVLGFQILSFAVFAGLTAILPQGEAKLLCECAMLCFVCPTAAAAGVITDRLGGNLSETITYVAVINLVAAILIPLAVPLVNPSEEVSFIHGFFRICAKVFPLLVLPLLLAWFVRYCLPRLQHFLLGYTHWAFYFWGVSLTFATYLATEALLGSGTSALTALGIAFVSLGACLIQFAAGKTIGKLASGSPTTAGQNTATAGPDAAVSPTTAGQNTATAGPDAAVSSITAGQTLGQKNTSFLIWLGYSFFTPVTSVAGGLYSIWQNLINTLELRAKER